MKRLVIPYSGGVKSTADFERGQRRTGRLAMEHIGVDLGKRESQIAILTDDGELINRRIRTEHARLVERFGRRPQAKILMEASTESEWVARCLEDLGHEVIVADPN
jgi:transposase